jgi:fatty acid desaturase
MPGEEDRQFAVRELIMIVIGLILLIIGFILSIPILWTLGIIVLVIGLGLALLGAIGHAVGGRRHYY